MKFKSMYRFVFFFLVVSVVGLIELLEVLENKVCLQKELNLSFCSEFH